MATKLELRLALRLLNARRRRFIDFQEDRRRWYRTEYRQYHHKFPTCIHGVSTYVDYDCACGACEDGDNYFDFPRDARMAIDLATRGVTEAQRRSDIVLQLPGHLRTVDVIDWACQPARLDLAYEAGKTPMFTHSSDGIQS